MATNGIFGDPDLDSEPEADAADAVNYDSAGNIKGGPLDDHPELTRRREAVQEIERMRAEHLQKMHALGDEVPMSMRAELDDYTRFLDEAKAKYDRAVARIYHHPDLGGPLPTEADFEQLRQSVPPAPKWVPLGRDPDLFGPGAPMPRVRPFPRTVPLNADLDAEFDHARAVSDVAADLQARGARVSLPPRRRRSRIRDRVLRWVFSVVEDMLEDAAERLIEARMHLDIDVDDLGPLPSLRDFPAEYMAPSVYDDYPELAHDHLPEMHGPLYCGVFSGGIGK